MHSAYQRLVFGKLQVQIFFLRKDINILNDFFRMPYLLTKKSSEGPNV